MFMKNAILIPVAAFALILQTRADDKIDFTKSIQPVLEKRCLECHGPDAKPQKLESEHLVTIFDGKVRLPEDYFAKVTVLPIKYGRGHPTDQHPVSDVMNPSDVNKVLKSVNCLSCHQPHSSAQPGMLVKDQANNTAFCMTCHTNFTK